jgi:KDO2-lipid IV(A) lauroyltransferase
VSATRAALVEGVLGGIARSVARLSPPARLRLGRALGFVAGSVLRIRRALVEAAMDRAGVASPAAMAPRMYAALGMGLAELLWLAAAPERDVDAAVAGVELDAGALAALDGALARGPVVLLASHTGNWELAAAAAARLLARRGRRLVVVAKPMRVRGVDMFVARVRARLGVRTLAPRGAIQGALRALASGEVVVTPIDQVPERAGHGLAVRFLRQEALADRAPATIAWRARATALVVAAHRSGAGRLRVEVLATAPPPHGAAPGRAWIDATTRSATAALEAFVQRAPEAWMWLHRRWRAPRAHGRRPEALVTSEEPG